MSKQTKNMKSNQDAIRPGDWDETLIESDGAAVSIRAGMTIQGLYPTSARPASRQEASQIKAQLIDAIDGLHHADLVALRNAVRILGNDHAGARWCVNQTRKHGATYMEMRRRHRAGRAK